jgi:SAM-dependent methyltransferase
MSQESSVPYDYDAIGPGYYDEVFRRGAGIQSKWHHLKFKHVRAQFPSGARDHLDIGCGPGTFIGTLPETMHCVGTDLAAAQIDYANREYGTPQHTFLCVRDGQLPFDDAQYDVVTLIELIEHIERPLIESLLREAARVLRPGGRLLLTTPNYASLWPLLEKVVNARAPVTYEDQHISFFTPGRLRALLRDCGFADPRVSTFQGVAPFVAALGWKLADRVQIVENPLLAPALGFLLLGSARKA